MHNLLLICAVRRVFERKIVVKANLLSATITDARVRTYDG